jgi:hypothetical protein
VVAVVVLAIVGGVVVRYRAYRKEQQATGTGEAPRTPAHRR